MRTPRHALRATVAGFLVAAVAVAPLLAVLLRRGADGYATWPIPLIALSVGMLGSGLWMRRRYALFAGALIGAAAGASSAWPFVTAPVEGPLRVASMTVAVFLTFGLLGGGFVELVLFLRRALSFRGNRA